MDVDRRCYKVSYWGPVSSGQLLDQSSSSNGLGWSLIRRLGTTNWLLRQAKRDDSRLVCPHRIHV